MSDFSFETFLIGFVLSALIGGVGLGFVNTYQTLTPKWVALTTAHSQIAVQLQRAQDLVPAIVGHVEKYAHHEREALEKVVKARNEALTARGRGISVEVAAEQRLWSALNGLLVVSEAYPDLKANQNFLHLQHEVAGLEAEIAEARERYNEAVGDYEKLRLELPHVLIAPVLRFERAQFFAVNFACDPVATGA